MCGETGCWFEKKCRQQHVRTYPAIIYYSPLDSILYVLVNSEYVMHGFSANITSYDFIHWSDNYVFKKLVSHIVVFCDESAFAY